jgi:hypothetical protein
MNAVLFTYNISYRKISIKHIKPHLNPTIFLTLLCILILNCTIHIEFK